MSLASQKDEYVSAAHLDPIFKPRWHSYSMKEIERIIQIGPLDELPAGMNPPAFRSRRAPMPPVMLYGWMINQDDWFEYAKKHGHCVTTEIISLEGEDDPDFELQDFDEDNLPAELITTTEDKYSSVCGAFWAIMHDLGIEPIDIHQYIQYEEYIIVE